MLPEVRVVVDRFSKPELVRAMQERNENDLYAIMWVRAFGNVYGARRQVEITKECYRVLGPS